MKVVTKHLATAAPLDVVLEATMRATQKLGGQMTRVSPDTFRVVNGNANVQFAFVANTQSDISIRPVPGGYDIVAYINMTPNAVFWICAVVGFFFLWFLWIACALYFFIDPSPQYNQAFDSIQIY
jgi:hypothetical protein